MPRVDIAIWAYVIVMHSHGAPIYSFINCSVHFHIQIREHMGIGMDNQCCQWNMYRSIGRLWTLIVVIVIFSNCTISLCFQITESTEQKCWLFFYSNRGTWAVWLWRSENQFEILIHFFFSEFHEDSMKSQLIWLVMYKLYVYMQYDHVIIRSRKRNLISRHWLQTKTGHYCCSIIQRSAFYPE